MCCVLLLTVRMLANHIHGVCGSSPCWSASRDARWKTPYPGYGHLTSSTDEYHLEGTKHSRGKADLCSALTGTCCGANGQASHQPWTAGRHHLCHGHRGELLCSGPLLLCYRYIFVHPIKAAERHNTGCFYVICLSATSTAYCISSIHFI